MRARTLLAATLLFTGCAHRGTKAPPRSVSLAERPPTTMAALERMQARDRALADYRAGKYPTLGAAYKAGGAPSGDPTGELAAWSAGYDRALKQKVAQDKFEAKLDATVAAMKKSGR